MIAWPKQGLIVLAGIALLLGNQALAYTDSDSVDVQARVANCNNNTICEPALGENTFGCPVDCPATTTPEEPSVLPSGPQTNSYSSAILGIYGLSATTTINSVALSWHSSLPSTSVFSWGLTGEYEQGTLTEISASYDHQVQLYGLKPGTVYFYKIVARGFDPTPVVRYEGSFVTQKILVLSPANVSNLQVVLTPDQALSLSWHNPSLARGDYVRVLESDTFYPLDPLNGKILYEGRGESFLARGLASGKTYYFTVFVYHQATRQFSSGQIISIYVPGVVPTGGLVTPVPSQTAPLAVNPFLIPSSLKPRPELSSLTNRNVTFIQDGQELPVISGTVSVQRSLPVTVRVTVDPTLMSQIETIIIYLRSSGSGLASYVLQATSEPGVYEGTLSGLGTGDSYQYAVSVYQNIPEPRHDILGTLLVRGVTAGEKGGFVPHLPQGLTDWLFLILVFVLILLIVVWRRRRSD